MTLKQQKAVSENVGVASSSVSLDDSSSSWSRLPLGPRLVEALVSLMLAHNNISKLPWLYVRHVMLSYATFGDGLGMDCCNDHLFLVVQCGTRVTILCLPFDGIYDRLVYHE
jgi:hypothetical protein